VANLFVSALARSKKQGKDIETIKGLNFLVTDRKLDRRAVSILTKLYLSKKFALFVEKATEILNLCPHEFKTTPVLWNILGERNPQKFICQYTDCVHLGTQVTMVSSTIPVEFEGKVISKIKKGDYYSCRYLTEELANLYKKIAALGQ
jgi:hypothetical protein